MCPRRLRAARGASGAAKYEASRISPRLSRCLGSRANGCGVVYAVQILPLVPLCTLCVLG